jgi:hypothetical protein
MYTALVDISKLHSSQRNNSYTMYIPEVLDVHCLGGCLKVALLTAKHLPIECTIPEVLDVYRLGGCLKVALLSGKHLPIQCTIPEVLDVHRLGGCLKVALLTAKHLPPPVHLV